MEKPSFLGYWKITQMEVWGEDYIDLVVPGFIQFDKNGGHLGGNFQFGTVAGWLDCRLQKVGDTSFIEWSWEGQNDNDPGSGRGWAELDGAQLTGRFYIHLGDDSAFEAVRQEPPGIKKRGEKRQLKGTRLSSKRRGARQGPELPWSLHKTEGWRGQRIRMQRWLERVRNSTNEVDRSDFLFAFFVSTAALGDWLLAEKRSLQPQIEALLARDADLRLARDLANLHKHRSLADPKTGREPSLAREYVPAPVGGGDSSSLLVVLSRGTNTELSELAERCVRNWDDFLRGVGLLGVAGAA